MAKFFLFCFYSNVMQVNALKNTWIFNIVYKRDKSCGYTTPAFRKNPDTDVLELSSSKKTQKTDLLKLPRLEIINKIIASVKNHKNYIARGGEARVFKIEDTNYCIRIPYEAYDFKRSTISFDLNEKDRINHVVAKFSNGAAIMKYIEGFTLSKRMSHGELNENTVDSALLSLPVSAFHGLFKQVCHAKDNDMIFDCSFTNVILNPEKKTLTAIDFYETDDYPEQVRPLRYMQEALTECGSFELKKQCALKIILGAIEELKPNVKPCLNIGEFRFADFMEKVETGNKLCRSQEWTKLKDILTDIECLKIKEIAGCNVKDMLEYKSEEVQMLIQVLSSCA